MKLGSKHILDGWEVYTRAVSPSGMPQRSIDPVAAALLNIGAETHPFKCLPGTAQCLSLFTNKKNQVTTPLYYGLRGHVQYLDDILGLKHHFQHRCGDQILLNTPKVTQKTCILMQFCMFLLIIPRVRISDSVWCLQLSPKKLPCREALF